MHFVLCSQMMHILVLYFDLLGWITLTAKLICVFVFAYADCWQLICLCVYQSVCHLAVKFVRFEFSCKKIFSKLCQLRANASQAVQPQNMGGGSNFQIYKKHTEKKTKKKKTQQNKKHTQKNREFVIFLARQRC